MVRPSFSRQELSRTLATYGRRCRSSSSRGFAIGLSAIDALLPSGGMVVGAVHEVLSATATTPYLFPALIARAAVGKGLLAWIDVERELNPPSLAAMDISLGRLLVLRPRQRAEQIWAIAECLRCKGVSACVSPAGKLSRIEARRLQLAAERGGGIGILLRPACFRDAPYAAATRWLVAPAKGERNVQRWSIQLIHAHGGRVGQTVILEACRETHHVRAFEAVADRQVPSQATPVSA